MTIPQFDQNLTPEKRSLKLAVGWQIFAFILIVILLISNPENRGVVALCLSGVSILIILGLCGYIYLRYRNKPQTKEKSRLKIQLDKASSSLSQTDGLIEKLARSQDRITSNEEYQLEQRKLVHILRTEELGD